MKRFRHELTRHGSLLAARVVQRQQALAMAWQEAELADCQQRAWQRAVTQLDENAASDRAYGDLLMPMGAGLAARCQTTAATAATARADYLVARAEAKAVHELLARVRARHDRAQDRAAQRQLSELLAGRLSQGTLWGGAP